MMLPGYQASELAVDICETAFCLHFVQWDKYGENKPARTPALACKAVQVALSRWYSRYLE